MKYTISTVWSQKRIERNAAAAATATDAAATDKAAVNKATENAAAKMEVTSTEDRTRNLSRVRRTS